MHEKQTNKLIKKRDRICGYQRRRVNEAVKRYKLPVKRSKHTSGVMSNMINVSNTVVCYI